jgi:hypothetical protein
MSETELKKFSEEEIYKNYLKRWSSLNVKLLRLADSINSSINEQTQVYLREYLQELKTIKLDEKKQFNS